MMLSGNSITQLDEATSIESIVGSMFLASQQDKYVANKWTSVKADGSQLMQFLADIISSKENLKSAAYTDADAYSIASHNHDEHYSRLKFEFPDKPSQDDALSIGNFFINGQLSALDIKEEYIDSAPEIKIDIEPPWKIGALKLCANPTATTNAGIDYRSVAFDGWMYPDGSSYMLSDFVLSNKLKVMYPADNDPDRFTLPMLSNFIKIVDTAGSEARWPVSDEIPGHNCLKRHQHPLQLKIDSSGNYTMTAKVYITKSAGYKNDSGYINGLHGGNGKITNNWGGGPGETHDLLDNAYWEKSIGKTNYNIILHNDIWHSNPFDVNASIQFTLNDVEIKNAGDNNDQTYPDHVFLPVMMYVGSKAEKAESTLQ